MTNDELSTLDALCRTDLVAASQWLDKKAMAARRSALASKVRVGTAPVFLPLPSDTTGPHARISVPHCWPEAYGALLGIAGLFEDVTRARKRIERGKGGAQERVAGLPNLWVDGAEKPTPLGPPTLAAMYKTPRSDSIVERAQALVALAIYCSPLRTLALGGHGREWIHDLVERHLAQLLIEHPILLHPRLFFEPNGAIERAPLAHIIATQTHGGLPSTRYGIKGRALREFVAHPAVHAALTERSAKVEINIGVHMQGMTLIESLKHSKTLAYGRLIGSLLQLERLRSSLPGALMKDAFFDSTPIGTPDILYAGMASSFGRAWLSSGRKDAHFLLEEMRETPITKRSSFLEFALARAPRALTDRTAVAKGAPAAPGTSAKEAMGRLARLQHALTHLQVAGCGSDASTARLVLQRIFPGAPKADPAQAAPLVTVEEGVAVAFIEAMTGKGLTFEEVAEHIRCSDACDGVWSAVLQAEEARLVMERAIASTTRVNESSQMPADTPGGTPVRRLRL